MTYKLPPASVADATTISNGVVRLAGDLNGTGTTAAAPTISTLTGLSGVVSIPSSYLKFGSGTTSSNGKLNFEIANTTLVGARRADASDAVLVIRNTDGNTKRLTAKTVRINKIKVLGNIYDNPELLGLLS